MANSQHGRIISIIGAILAVLLGWAHPALPAVAEHLIPPSSDATLRFAHLTTEDGLSHSVVTAILQDRQGFMWIGTQNGLNRYDGYEFMIYQHDPHNPNSLSHDHVTSLYEDAGGALWIATHGGGVNRFDPHTETFTRYQHDPENPNSIAGDTIFAIFEDSRGDFWFGGLPIGGGLSRLDAAMQTFTRYARRPVSPTEPQGGAVWKIIEDANGHLWLAADAALARLDPSTNNHGQPVEPGGQITYYTPGSDEGRLATLYQDESGTVWVGGNKGLYRFLPPSSNRGEPVEPPPTGTFTLYQPGYAIIVNDILPNDDGTFWIGTLGDGLYLFDPSDGRFLQHLTPDPQSAYSPSHDKIQALYRDRAGVLWVGTNKGLDLYDPRQSQFNNYAYDAENPNSLADGAVWGVCGATEPQPTLWIGTGMTLNQMDLDSGQISLHPLVADGLSAPPLASRGGIYCDPDGFVWAGIDALVYRFDKTSGEITTYDLRVTVPPEAPPVEINAFYRDGPVLWIGALRGGLIRFDLPSESFKLHLDPPEELVGQGDPRFLLSHDVSTIYGGRDGAIWIGYSTGALSRLATDADRFEHYLPDPNDPHSIPTDWITGIHQDQSGVLWLTARNGLVRFDPSPDAVGQEETFTLYTANDGLPNAFVTGIHQDRNSNLWLATTKGISQFDPQNEVFHNYDVADGLGSSEFSGASWQGPDGQIWWGGSDGLTAFDPDQVAVNPYQPPVVLTEFRLDNQPVTPGVVLAHAIWDTEQLTLRHDNDLVSFEFAALSYAAPHKHRYRYRLEGLEQDWVEVDSQHRFATYTHLPAGDYVFRVQGTNDSGVWSPHEVRLALTVLPAWWETWWFRGASLMLLVGLVAAGVGWRIRDLEQRSHTLEIQVAERTQELAARTARLQESERRFREMTELLPSAVVEMDDTLGITYVNQSGLALFGYTGQDIEDGLNAIDLLHPEDRKRAAQRIAGYLEGTYVPPTEYRVLKKDGTEMPVLLKAAPIRQAGEITGFRASIADVSKLKEAQTELAEALDAARRLQYEAESANRAKSAFLANMSHELRTPLNAILGYAQLMARDADVSPAQQEYLETIARSGEHLLGLINDVLTTSKIEAGRVTLQEQAFDLHRQLYGLQAMFQMRAGDKGLALHLEIAPQVPRYVLADEGKLRQVLMNLLSNAVKFTQEGGVVLRVGVGGQESGAMEEFSSLTNPQSQTQTQASSPQSPIPILFEVEDTGVGIAPQEMDTLFDPFVQTASGQRASEGTGLGLSISQQFVNLMDGELSVESTVGRGTVFRVQLPVAWADAGMVETLDALPQRRVTGVAPGQTAPDGGAFRLLIVEDDAANRDLLLGLLSPFGFEMRVAVDGAEGVETWEEWQPHLVWMDMRLPVLDGYAATRRIKARAKATGRSALVVALTASAFEQDRAAIFDAGCDDFVRKPYRDHEILDVLHRHLGVRFIYESDTPATRGSDDAAAGVSQQELRTAVADLSAKWVDDLYHAAVALDADQMHTLIEAIRPQAPHLADRLAQWVHDFEYDRVIALIRPAA